MYKRRKAKYSLTSPAHVSSRSHSLAQKQTVSSDNLVDHIICDTLQDANLHEADQGTGDHPPPDPGRDALRGLRAPGGRRE